MVETFRTENDCPPDRRDRWFGFTFAVGQPDTQPGILAVIVTFPEKPLSLMSCRTLLFEKPWAMSNGFRNATRPMPP